MGCCLSKTDPISPPPNPNPNPNKEKINLGEQNSTMEVKSNHHKKEVFLIHHRRSHDNNRPEPDPTKEEVDAVLNQCGRLSRSSSGKLGFHNKKSFDFEGEGVDVINGAEINQSSNSNNSTGGEDDERFRRRKSRGSHRRRSTLSRSRERVSTSPGKTRSESPIPSQPVKFVSVPPTVCSLSVENGNNGGSEVKRVLVKRNVGSSRSGSPARWNGSGGSSQASLSRNGSRKTEHSPYRRTPLNEIDMNSLPFHPLSNKKLISSAQDNHNATHNIKAGGGRESHRRTRSRGGEGFEVTKTNYCRVNEVQNPTPKNLTEPISELMNPTGYDALVTPVIVSGCSDNLKLPRTLMRSRSSRRSRDFDLNIDALTTPTPVSDYNSLLLQDIQKFHQKSNTASSNTNFNNSSTSDKLRLSTPKIDSKNGSNARLVVESEVKMVDDLMEPSLHKYVTMRKTDGVESSGSSSIHNWVSSSSADCCTSKSYISVREDGLINPVGFQNSAISEFGCGDDEECEEKLSRGGARGRFPKATVCKTVETSFMF